MPHSVVADAGGVLVLCGALEGTAPAGVIEVLALDWTAVTVGRFLAARHEGNQRRGRVEIGVALRAVHEWFPVRTLAADILERAGLGAVDILTSEHIEIYRPW